MIRQRLCPRGILLVDQGAELTRRGPLSSSSRCFDSTRRFREASLSPCLSFARGFAAYVLPSSANYLLTNIILILSAIAHTLLDHLESSQIRSAAQRARPFAFHYHIHTRVRYEVGSRVVSRLRSRKKGRIRGGRSIRYY